MWPMRNKKKPIKFNCDFKADSLGTAGKSLAWSKDPAFVKAWSTAQAASRIGWDDGVPDIRWRAHVAIWAASVAMRLEGDFVECGVHTGILSHAICDYFKWKKVPKEFWLFDTWGGIPTEDLTAAEKTIASAHNSNIYNNEGIFPKVFLEFEEHHRAENITFVRGVLPGVLHSAKIEKIAYLSIDLNNAAAEKGCIEALWGRVVSGGIVLIDDYGWEAHRDQRVMWDTFSAGEGRMVVTLPTGQGVLVK